MRVTIAAQACLLLLNRRTDYYPGLRQILVYPGAFIVDRVQKDDAGVLQDRRQVLSGESWAQGQVVLSWEDVLDGAAIPDDGRNVVIHEFAHQLDQQKGHANGAPILARRGHYRRWSRVLGEEFGRLQEQARSRASHVAESLRRDEPRRVLRGHLGGLLRAAAAPRGGTPRALSRALPLLSRGSVVLVGSPDSARGPFAAIGHGPDAVIAWSKMRAPERWMSGLSRTPGKRV